MIGVLTLSLLLPAVSAFADLAQVEEAIIKEDYTSAKLLAEEILKFAVVEKPVTYQTNYYLALSELRLGEYPEATNIFKKLLKEDLPQDLKDKSYLGLFEAYYDQEEYHKAQKIAKTMIKKSRHSSFGSLMYLKLARSYLKLAQWEKARETLEKVVHDYPDSVEAHTAQQLLEEKQYFAVQIGAFLDRQRAENLVEELKSRQKYAYIVETVDRDNRTFYRVRVGQLARLKEAKVLKSALSEEGYPARIYP